MRRIACMLMLALFLSLCCPYAATYALTQEQCMFFSVNGRNAICHETGSVKNPFVLLYISTQACIEGHVEHPEDFISLNNASCQPICLPLGAPCDPTLPCCDEGSCTSGGCVN